MNKKIKNTTGLFLVILFACLSFSPLLAQTEEEMKEYGEKVKNYMESVSDQKIPADFFLGEWGGTIHGEIVYCKKQNSDDCPPCTHDPFKIEFIGYPARYALGPTSGGAQALIKMTATWPTKFTICDTVTCMILPSHNAFIFQYPVTNGTETEIGYNIIFYDAGFDIELNENEEKDNNVINISSGGVDPDMWKDSGGKGCDAWAKGELHSIYVKKDTLGKTVFVDEPIKTDKYTQKDIVVPEVGVVEVKPGSECKFKNKNTLEQFKGKMRNKVENLPSGNFGITTPVAIAGVRGTDFITIVGKNSTTLKVFEGEVAFSDINNEKTVIVKKNQMSTVKDGGVPSEPKEMDLASKWFSVH